MCIYKFLTAAPAQSTRHVFFTAKKQSVARDDKKKKQEKKNAVCSLSSEKLSNSYIHILYTFVFICRRRKNFLRDPVCT